jgi:DNA uptake protein ComE-like DNA-binding protein
MALPGMTEPLADAILDWIDTDDNPRAQGAEALDYSRMGYPYGPRNGPLHSIEELLLVRDMTPALLFGADLNRDGLVQAVETPLTAIVDADNSNRELDRGWAAYLTLDSAERNVRPDGRPKIDVNMANLELLHEQLTEVLSEEQANFIIAFRQGGAYTGTENGVDASSLNLDFTQQGRTSLTSILDLVGARTRVVQTGTTTRSVVNTPFTDDASEMANYLPILMQNLAANAAPSLPGRLNINQAPRLLLMGLPGIDPVVVDQIIANRDVQLGIQMPDQIFETWLLSQGLVDLAKMKQLLPLITTGGDVYRVRSVGYFDGGGPVSRIEAVLDATQRPPVVVRRWELETLGQNEGYRPEDLGATSDAVPAAAPAATPPAASVR